MRPRGGGLHKHVTARPTFSSQRIGPQRQQEARMRKVRGPFFAPQARGRAGLAPLELVLSLPLLLLVMALMIIFGTAGAWKVRALANSRQAVWREFTPRRAAGDPRPRGWPLTAEFRAQQAQPSPLPDDPFADFAVVRGPVLVDPHSGASLPVNADTLNVNQGLRDGFARIRRDYPLLEKLPPHQIDFTVHHHVLDGTKWRYSEMGIGSNITRRIPFLYPMDLQTIVPDLANAYTAAAMQVHLNPNKPRLTPLEGGDPEIYQLIGRHSPDFQPQIPLGALPATIPALRGLPLRPRDACSADLQQVHDEYVTRLLERIRGVPRAMTDYYISVYQSVIDRLQSADPPPPGAATIISDLEAKIEQLQQFRARL